MLENLEGRCEPRPWNAVGGIGRGRGSTDVEEYVDETATSSQSVKDQMMILQGIAVDTSKDLESELEEAVPDEEELFK